MRDTTILDAAILANRENPTPENAAAVMVAMRVQNEAFMNEQTADYMRRATYAGPASFRTVQGFKEWAFYRHDVRIGTLDADNGTTTMYGEFRHGILAVTFDDTDGRIVGAYAHCEHMSHGLGGTNTLRVLMNMVTKGRPT